MFEFFITAFLNQPAEIMSLVSLGITIVLMLAALRYFGSIGLVVFICIAIIVTNIQVLKLVSYRWCPDPVAYGTITFATTFLASDILTEYYGKNVAKQAIFIGFGAMLMTTILMTLTLAAKPDKISFDIQAHMMALFNPAPQLFFASIIAYFCSLSADVYIFARISRLTQRRFLWFRTNAATIFATTLDNIIFSILAWILFAPDPLAWDVVIRTYILGTLLMRIVIAVVTSPVLYWARYFLPPHEKLILLRNKH